MSPKELKVKDLDSLIKILEDIVNRSVYANSYTEGYAIAKESLKTLIKTLKEIK